MLRSLNVRNFVVIDKLELEFQNGLSVLTGETGAGKSIIIDAIGLVLGDRADTGSIRAAQDSAEIILVIEVAPNSKVDQWLEAHDFDHDGDCILRRVIRKDGKSRAYINNVPVPLKTLKELGEHAINIYGQHAHQDLMHAPTQRELVDRFAVSGKQLQALETSFHAWRALKEKYDSLSANSAENAAAIELLSYQVQELEQLNLQIGELEELEQSHARLSNADSLKQASMQAYYQLDNDENTDISSQLSSITQNIQLLTEKDAALQTISNSLNEASVLLSESANELRNYADSIEANPEELSAIDDRLALIDDIARKHKIEARDITDLYTRLSNELEKYSHPDYDLDSLQQSLQAAEQDYIDNASKISKARVAAAKKISKQVTDALAKLGMEKARLEVQVGQQQDNIPRKHGLDTIEFRIQTNPGQKLSPLAQVASGGELSRISLAIQMIAVDKLDVPVIVFDEVDSGVGGAIAEVVGIELQAIAKHRQVICITHLPQVAAKAHNHYRVNKQSDKKQTSAAIETLDSSERITEIARMLGGVKLTENTFLHAREMLEGNLQ